MEWLLPILKPMILISTLTFQMITHKKLSRSAESQLKKRNRYLLVKLLAECNYLTKRRTKSVKRIVTEFPNIGKVIETFVSERNIGADACRRTGVLTFDGNSNVKEKVTYKWIQQHLQDVYGRKFSFGTVVQLCVAQNRRHSDWHIRQLHSCLCLPSIVDHTSPTFSPIRRTCS